MKISVRILTKKGFLSPADETIKKALHQMGYTNIKRIRLGRYLDIDVDEMVSASERRAQIDTACKSAVANLANPVMEDWEIDIVP